LPNLLGAELFIIAVDTISTPCRVSVYGREPYPPGSAAERRRVRAKNMNINLSRKYKVLASSCLN
jgi:hypothetical protein